MALCVKEAGKQVLPKCGMERELRERQAHRRCGSRSAVEAGHGPAAGRRTPQPAHNSIEACTAARSCAATPVPEGRSCARRDASVGAALTADPRVAGVAFLLARAIPCDGRRRARRARSPKPAERPIGLRLLPTPASRLSGLPRRCDRRCLTADPAAAWPSLDDARQGAMAARDAMASRKAARRLLADGAAEQLQRSVPHLPASAARPRACCSCRTTLPTR
ncbi:hypothetical protein KX924_01630 [Streptomyces sp. II-2-2-2]